MTSHLFVVNERGVVGEYHNTVSRVCIVGNCWQWVNFTMGTNVQNQHFSESRQKVCLYIHEVVLRRGLQSLGGKLERFVTKTRVRQTITPSHWHLSCHGGDSNPASGERQLAFSGNASDPTRAGPLSYLLPPHAPKAT